MNFISLLNSWKVSSFVLLFKTILIDVKKRKKPICKMLSTRAKFLIDVFEQLTDEGWKLDKVY